MITDNLSHINRDGEASMVNVGEKKVTQRVALASCKVLMQHKTLCAVREGRVKKGDAFTVAKVAGIMAAKKTAELIPMCHSLPVEHVEINFEDLREGTGVQVTCVVSTSYKTGVEMEAMSGVSVAALTLYDMAKSMDPGMVITETRLVKKIGGKSDYQAR